ncbi:MAG: hypothetical protein WC491_08825 [Candidatus Omnitrophota bacterium]|jgi:hypothetical protein
MSGITIKGYVTIRQADKVLAKCVRNHFVNGGLKGLISTLIHKNIQGTTTWYNWYSDWKIYIGSDVDTPTNVSQTALVTPIGAAPGTAPNINSASIKSGAVDGIWSIKYIATWNAGTVSGTLGEVALYMRAPDKSDFGWTVTSNYTPSTVMVSRLSSAGLDLSSFIIDEDVPLTVEWTVQLAFA